MDINEMVRSLDLGNGLGQVQDIKRDTLTLMDYFHRRTQVRTQILTDSCAMQVFHWFRFGL